MGAFRGDDGDLLYSACRHCQFPCGNNEKAAGTSGFPADSFADADDLRHDSCGHVPPASAPQKAAKRAHPARTEKYAGGTA